MKTALYLIFSLALAFSQASELSLSLEKARELIEYVQIERSQPDRKTPKPKLIVESEAIDFFQRHPESLTKDASVLYEEIQNEQGLKDPTRHVRLLPPKGQPGYEDLKVFASHPYRMGKKKIPASNLVQVWREFLRQAEKEIILNVYEFDLDEVAYDLILAVGRGITVHVGVDSDAINEKPQLRQIYEKLKSGGVQVTAVDSVGINHQKMAAIDWTLQDKARVLFSSGNLTQSCLGPEGDLKSLKPIPKESIPNANHVITIKSWLAANLVHHELEKTFSESLDLRGADYPTTGSYQITGPQTSAETLEAYPEGSFIISFTPGGGYESINKNILSHFINRSKGPIRLVQFAYSASSVSESILNRALEDYRSKGKFDFLSIGDTPFAMQGWSQFLKMSGLKRLDDVGEMKVTKFEEDPASPWVQLLDKKNLNDLRSKVRIAPKIYGNSWVSFQGKKYEVSSKIHHKLMAAGEFAIVGTSFNFSEGAESNNEQILVFRDPMMVQFVHGVAQELSQKSSASVFQEAQRRNKKALYAKPALDEGVLPEKSTEGHP